MVLDVDIRHAQGAFNLHARFQSDGKLTALFGPSGSGKTTVVNAIGGLVRPDHARIAVQGRVLVDTKKGVFVPKHRRRIGYVFQEGRLFPHLSVRQNLLYGRFFTPHADRFNRLEIAELAEHIMQTKTADFDPATLEDRYRAALVKF